MYVEVNGVRACRRKFLQREQGRRSLHPKMNPPG
jgi:hypothetical protein